MASYSQESTRYCNYTKSKFSNSLTFIIPEFWDENDSKYTIWKSTLESIEKNYIQLIKAGATPQEARSILPNSLKTEIIVSMNIRSWRNFFKLRTSNKSHPQMIELVRPLLNELKEKLPVLFDDIDINRY